MPEELAIALLVLFVIGWVLFKFVSAASRAASDAHKGFRKTVEEMRVRRFEERKAKLAPQIRFLLPDDLGAERALNRLKDEFLSRKAKTGLTPVRPSWERRAFLKHHFSPQREFCSEMNIAEIDAILSPDPVPWSQKELALIATDCEYPASAPVSACEELDAFIVSPLQIREAVFDFDHKAVRERDVVRYFRDEQARVAKYAARRLDLLAKHAELTKQIETWNAELYLRWKSYCKDSARLLQEEAEKFRLHVEQYRKDCNEQAARFKAQLDGFKNRGKESVIERVGCVLGSLNLPASVPRVWDIDFDEEQRILIVEVGLPDVVHRPPGKNCSAKECADRKASKSIRAKGIYP